MISEGRTEWSIVAIPTLQHFLVDALCVCCLYMLLAADPFTNLLITFIMYNVLAFLTQPLTGWLTDRIAHKHWLLLASMLLLTLAVALFILLSLQGGETGGPTVGAVLVALLLGLGNSFFHVWGGQQVAVLTQNDMRAIGVYVSTGAFGLAVGAVFASWWLLLALLVGYLACFAVVLHPSSVGRHAKWETHTMEPENTIGKGLQSHSPYRWSFILLILAFVAFRSKAGITFSAGLEQTQQMVLMLGFVAMAGKAFGGFLCRWTGLWRGVAAMLIVTATAYILPLFSSLDLSPFLGLFAINCTMPVTLYLANKLLPGHEGLSFGLLAAALMPAYLLKILPHQVVAEVSVSFLLPLVATIVIEWLVLWALYERRRSVILSSVAINVLTNVPLNLLIQASWLDGLTQLVVAEGVIVLVEALWYFCFVRNWRQSFAYSALCNAISFLVGLLFQFLYMYFYY